MPQIIVMAGVEDGLEQATVMLRERVNATDFDSERFAANLLERLGWAVEDATAAERREPAAERREPAAERQLSEATASESRQQRRPEPVGV
jgi:hypothetical protein